MKYLLDTDTCIYAIKRDEKVLSRMLRERRIDIAISVITEGELFVGAGKSANSKKTSQRLEHFLKPIQRLVFTSKDAGVYAKVRTTLEKQGKSIGPNDSLIAAHAMSRGLILVSNNTREFSRVKDLQLENWK